MEGRKEEGRKGERETRKERKKERKKGRKKILGGRGRVERKETSPYMKDNSITSLSFTILGCKLLP
jgi:hypothetical protein